MTGSRGASKVEFHRRPTRKAWGIDGAPTNPISSVTSVAVPCLQVETSITFAIFAVPDDEEPDQLIAKIVIPRGSATLTRRLSQSLRRSSCIAFAWSAQRLQFGDILFSRSRSMSLPLAARSYISSPALSFCALNPRLWLRALAGILMLLPWPQFRAGEGPERCDR